VYVLPAPAVHHLGEARPSGDTEHRARRALLSEAEVAAEEAFRQTCEEYGTSTVGVHNGCPVLFSLLCSPPPLRSIAPELVDRLGWAQILPSGTVDARLQGAQKQSEQARRRILGFAGYLTFNEQYQAEKESLQERWAALDVQTPLPFRANVHDQPPSFMAPSARPRGKRLPDATSTFLNDLGTFLRKWQLMELTTWDLPWPQGPLGNIPPDLVRLIHGPTHNVSTLPAFYDLPSSVQVREEIRTQQQMAAEQVGLKGDFPVTGLGGRGDGPSIEAAAFRLWLIEKTVLGRYGKPHGLAARLQVASAEILQCSEERIRQIRKVYLPFLPSPLGA